MEITVAQGETREAISVTWYGSGYVIDPHTAVAQGFTRNI